MRYEEFRERIREGLRRHPGGRTWAELRDGLGLPYDRPCPEWVDRLEEELGLSRTGGAGRAYVWKLRVTGAATGRARTRGVRFGTR
jgi:hypothetical protein